MRRSVALVAVALGMTAAAATEPAGITAARMGLVINDRDPASREIGEYYARRRGIPRMNVVHVAFPLGNDLTPLQFAGIKRVVDAQLGASVQALALAWTAPFRVGCMSVTSAFAFGFDPAWCATGCQRTPFSPYYNSDSHAPFTDFGIRPAMSIAALDVASARALVERGISADGSAPHGTGYLLSTSDRDRNARATSFSSARLLAQPGFQVDIRRADALHSRRDVLFYFTGSRWVAGLRSNTFLPGAIADHLTSSGGVLLGGRQMSALEWLQAGATGSYGTVVEPCAFTAKFPSPPIVMRRYLAGETLIEAYWKSVAMPSQGIFIGEPLAAPFRRHP